MKTKNININGVYYQIQWYLTDDNKTMFYVDGATARGIAKGQYSKANGISIDELLLQKIISEYKIIDKKYSDMRNAEHEKYFRHFDEIRQQEKIEINTMIQKYIKDDDTISKTMEQEKRKIIKAYAEVVNNGGNYFYSTEYAQKEIDKLNNFVFSL